MVRYFFSHFTTWDPVIQFHRVSLMGWVWVVPIYGSGPMLMVIPFMGPEPCIELVDGDYRQVPYGVVEVLVTTIIHASLIRD